MGQARQPRAYSESHAAPSSPEAGGRASNRQAGQSAGASGRSRAGGGARSDRDGDRQSRGSRPPADRQRARGQEVTVMNAPVADPPPTPRDPWRRRLVNTLLYGRNVDRTVKARARIGLAILIFAIGYSIIATRLVIFAAVPDSHGPRRAMGPDAGATARPAVPDPNGEMLATAPPPPSP